MPNTTPSEVYGQLQAEVLARCGTRAESLFLEVGAPSLQAHVLRGGAGAPAVLVHGGGLTAVSWEPLLARLQDSVLFYAVDRPGCGLTGKVDYTDVLFRRHAVTFMGALLDRLELDQTVLIGNSMGGYWVIVFALAFPARVSRLVLVGAPAGVDRHVPLQMRILGVKGVNRLLYSTVARPSIAWTRYLFRSLLVADIRNVPRWYLECVHAGSRLPGAERSWLTMLEQVLTPLGFRRKYYLRDEMPQLRMPVLFVWSDGDGFAAVSSGAGLCDRMRNARLEIIHGAGHLPWLDRPDATAAAILRFLV